MQTNTRQTFQGLDTIRFVCAIWVVISHLGGIPIFDDAAKSNIIGAIVRVLYRNLCPSGSTAVIIFFVISGFCIHYPHSKQLEIPNLLEYFSRRYLRVGVPLLMAMTISALFKTSLDSILWSLIAELIYYTIYPVMLQLLRSGYSVRQLLIVSAIASFLLILTDPTAKNYHSFGSSFNWLLALPCWLIGVQLADSVVTDTVTSKPRHIWSWRVGIIGANILLNFLRFHSPIGHPWTLNFFAILVFFWLFQEIRFYQHKSPAPLLEWAGKWSYSLYLTHILAQAAFLLLPQVDLGLVMNWVVRMLFILLSSYLFGLLFEFPSHRLARIVGNGFRSQTSLFRSAKK
jgi:peptidoglycan/LPS O-acetylase OafA/YrhL